MKKSDTLVTAVIYPGIEPYIEDYFDSLEHQDSKDFDLLVVVDGLPHFELPKTSFNRDVISALTSVTTAGIRSEMVLHAVRNRYEHLVFSDADDFFSENRVSASIAHLDGYDFVFNELDLVDEQGNVLETGVIGKIHPADSLTDPGGIVDFNILGLTHTAVDVAALERFEKVEDLLAFDWWVFTTLLLCGARGKFVPGATTFYRQTESNIVGMMHPLTPERLRRGIGVKTDHYLKALEFCETLQITDGAAVYNRKHYEMASLATAIENERFRGEYIAVVNRNLNQIFKGWWSEILPLTDWRTYDI